MQKTTQYFMLIMLFTQLLFSASAEQIEAYLSISKADRELVEIEQVFESMKAADDNSTQEINQIYTQYLEEHLSNNELEEVLALYRTPIMQRYVVEMDLVDIPTEEMKIFLESLEENPLTTERLDIIDGILKHTINDEQILAFYSSMTQRYRPKQENNNSKNQDENRTKEPTKQEESFLKTMKKGAKEALLYGTQVLSIEEMNELEDALKSSILSKVSKVESSAMVKVMNTFIENMSREPKKNEENNSSL